MMKLKSILLLSLSLLCVSTANADKKEAQSAHQQAHAASTRHLAKSTQPIDANKLSNFIEQEIVARESKTAMSSADSRLIDDLLTEANKHIGKPYVHGAKGPSAFDCSGFSSYVYRQFGYKISPASRVQATEGEPVAAGDLRKGDLVFFTSRSSGGNVGHVGIVVSADNANGTFKFIHASIKGVKISECEGYYKNRYLGARRIINSSK